MSAPAIEKRLWAPIRVGRRGRPDWPVFMCMGYTRREAKEKFLGGTPAELHAIALRGVRFARITVIEQSKEAPHDR